MKLPGYRDLGQVPSARGGRPMASYDTSAIGRGIAQLGQGISQLAGDVGDIAATRKQEVSKQEEFATNSRFLAFSAQQEDALNKMTQSQEPGAFGFREKALDSYSKAAKDFYASVPEGLKPEFDQKLFKVQDSLVSRAGGFETQQRKGFYTQKVNDGLVLLENKLYDDPKSYDTNVSEGNAFIDSVPDEDLTPIERADMKRQWEKKAKIASLNGMKPDQRLEALGENVGVSRPLPKEVEGRAQHARDRFVALGYEPHQAAGIVGNLVQESGVRSDGAVGDNGTAFGLAQWRGERLNQLKRFAASRGTDWSDFDTQIDFIDLELKNSETSAYNRLKSASNVDEATAAFIGYERPRGYSDANPRGGHGWANRLAAAQRVAGEPVTASARGETDPRYADVDYETREKLIFDSQKELSLQDKAEQDAVANNRRLTKERFELGITQNEVPSERVILENPDLTDGEKAGLIRSYRSATDERAGVDELLGAIQAGGRVSINRFDEDQTKVAEKAYDRLISSAPAETRGAATQEFVQATGYIPKLEMAGIRAGASSRDPAQFVTAMSTASRYQQAAPEQFDDAEGLGATRKSMEMFNTLRNDLGYTDAEAAQRVIDGNDPEKKKGRDALLASEEVKKTVKDITSDDVAGIFDKGILSSAPQVGANPGAEAVITGDYRKLLEESIVDANGDVDAARALADGRFRKMYGTSEFSLSPDTVFKYPIENYYPVGSDGTHAYIADQAKGELAKEGVVTDEVFFQPDLQTAGDIKAGKAPRFSLWYKRDGKLELFPGMFSPDAQTDRFSENRVNRDQNIKAMREVKKADERLIQKDAGVGAVGLGGFDAVSGMSNLGALESMPTGGGEKF